MDRCSYMSKISPWWGNSWNKSRLGVKNNSLFLFWDDSSFCTSRALRSEVFSSWGPLSSGRQNIGRLSKRWARWITVCRIVFICGAHSKNKNRYVPCGWLINTEVFKLLQQPVWVWGFIRSCVKFIPLCFWNRIHWKHFTANVLWTGHLDVNIVWMQVAVFQSLSRLKWFSQNQL